MAPLAEALSGRARARTRARGSATSWSGSVAPGRESVQQLMTRVELGGPPRRRLPAARVRRRRGPQGADPPAGRPRAAGAARGGPCLVLNGSRRGRRDPAACAEARPAPRSRSARRGDPGIRDERASALFAHLVRTLDRRALPRFYLAVLVALSASRSDDASGALDYALRHRDWRTPMLNRQFRAAAAGSLRRMDTPASLEALRGAASAGPRGSRAAARSALAGRG